MEAAPGEGTAVSVFEARKMTVRYGAVVANSDIDIVLEPGTVHGVIGPNGAGKSTFIDALSGRKRPTSGEVLLDGTDITRRSVGWRRHHGISRSFQRTSVFGSMTVRAQLEMVARRNNETALGEIIEILGLGGVADLVCSEIAYGTQRLVDLAIALIGRPRVVLLDEPCAGLVADESVRMLDHVKTLCVERKVAALLVEHDVDGVFRTCDRITVLDLGRVLAAGEPAAVRADPAVIKAYLGSAA
jgi:branched-chain amino acid transport system ATP-binding protein